MRAIQLTRYVLAFITVAFLLRADGQAGTITRDFSGDAMQLHDSRMMNSPLQPIPTLLGLSFWPFISYLPAPAVTVHVDLPSSTLPTPIPPTAASAHPQFWINRCGNFVQIEVSPKMNLVEEEQRPCAH